jgi:signal transduction histidine kinase
LATVKTRLNLVFKGAILVLGASILQTVLFICLCGWTGGAVVPVANNQLQAVAEQSHGVEGKRSSDVTELRNQLRECIFVTLALNMLLAVCGAAYLFGIAGRLFSINDNLMRYSLGAPLNPPHPGTDELAVFDTVLFETTHKLKGTQEKLLHNTARLSELLDTLPLGVLVVNKYGVVETINETFIRTFFQIKKKKLIGKSIDVLFPGLWQSIPFENLGSDRVRVVENLSTKIKGKVVELSVRQFQMPDGPRIILAVQDITERRKLDQQKADFISMVTHDLKTPLTSIHLFHQLLRKNVFGGLPPTATSPLESAERSLERLLGLVNGLLDFERVAAGQLQLNLGPSKLSTIINRSLESVALFADEYGVTIKTTDLEADLIVDEERMVQVLVNMLSNAIKFSRPGSSVYVEADWKNTGWLEIAVRDYGRGIALAQQELIFERYRQVDPTDALEGTGLGLPICKGIISQHQGFIGVKSENGIGSRFWFRIPMPAKHLNFHADECV